MGLDQRGYTWRKDLRRGKDEIEPHRRKGQWETWDTLEDPGRGDQHHDLGGRE